MGMEGFVEERWYMDDCNAWLLLGSFLALSLNFRAEAQVEAPISRLWADDDGS
jgi:hypothetical protein